MPAPRRTSLAAALDGLYAAFDRPGSARDPIEVVRRYPRLEDREVVAFVAAGLAFGRVGSVIASVEAVCDRLGASPGQFVRGFDPGRDGRAFEGFVHRWTRGTDLTALLCILQVLIGRHGSIEHAVARHLAADTPDVGGALDRLADEARGVDLRPAYGHRLPDRPGVHYFFARPSSGSACKRLNLFLRWMVRRDGVDPGGWEAIRPGQLIVPLDTHTIRVGRCLRLTTRRTPGWRMAAEITASLRRIDPEDPVRYDFALCHLGMMGNCGWQTAQRDAQCPLRGVCRPGRGAARRVRGAAPR